MNTRISQIIYQTLFLVSIFCPQLYNFKKLPENFSDETYSLKLTPALCAVEWIK
jgi:hypothetical protein